MQRKNRNPQLVEQTFSSLSEALMRGEKIEIQGFGTFTVRQYRAYDGRNPRTGAIVQAKPKRLAFFKVGKDMRCQGAPPSEARSVLLIEGPEPPHRSSAGPAWVGRSLLKA